MAISLSFSSLWDGVNGLVGGVGPLLLYVAGLALGLVLLGVLLVYVKGGMRL